jgi:hypothetical protein
VVVETVMFTSVTHEFTRLERLKASLGSQN